MRASIWFDTNMRGDLFGIWTRGDTSKTLITFSTKKYAQDWIDEKQCMRSRGSKPREYEIINVRIELDSNQHTVIRIGGVI